MVTVTVVTHQIKTWWIMAIKMDIELICSCLIQDIDWLEVFIQCHSEEFKSQAIQILPCYPLLRICDLIVGHFELPFQPWKFILIKISIIMQGDWSPPPIHSSQALADKWYFWLSFQILIHSAFWYTIVAIKVSESTNEIGWKQTCHERQIHSLALLCWLTLWGYAAECSTRFTIRL